MLTLRALVSDESLMYGLVLKGGNALQLAYGMTNRASMDIDFSISDDFSGYEISRIEGIVSGLLNSEFEKHNLLVFDINFYEKPKQREVKEWKGYKLEFKVIDTDKFDPTDMDKSRRNAYSIYGNSSTKFQVEISSYEYTDPKKLIEVEGTVFYVYTPEMIVMEKIRALCQSMPDYKDIIPTAKVKGRARDFYDIWNICQTYSIDFNTDNSKRMLQHIFDAKRVPLEYLDYFEKYKDLQKEDWNNVVDTLTVETHEGFNYYFEFVLQKVKELKTP